MYTLNRTMARATHPGSRWQSVDAADVPVLDLRNQFGQVWLIVTHPGFLGEEKAVYYDDLYSFLDEVENPNQTTAEWLASLGSRALPFVDPFPQFDARYVRYVNAWAGGYSVEPVDENGTLEQIGSKHDKEDLLVFRDDLDPQQVVKRAMFTVNGYFHLADASREGVRIIDGNRTVRRGNDNQVGVYSFTEVGDIRYVPITGDMIEPRRPGYDLLNGLWVTLPEDIDLTNKTVLFVIGGYLHPVGDAFRRVSDRIFNVRLTRLMLLERYFDSFRTLDLSGLGLTPYEFNESLISTEEFLSDAVIRNYFALSQSFVVVVDSPPFFSEREPLEQISPGRHLVSTWEQLPLVGSYGKMLDYHVVTQDDQVVLAASLNPRHRYDAQRQPWRKQQAVDDGRYSANPYEHAQAYVWRLGVEQ